MIFSKQEAIDAIISHIRRFGQSSDWYVGITNDPDRREREHRNSDYPGLEHFAYLEVDSREVAHAIEHYICKRYKTINSCTIGGARSDSKYVYVFKV